MLSHISSLVQEDFGVGKGGPKFNGPFLATKKIRFMCVCFSSLLPW